MARGASLFILGLFAAMAHASRSAAQEPLVFEAANYATGACPATIAAADLDGDGRLDLIVANHHTHEFSIYAGNGAGGFEPRPGIPVPGEHDSHALSLALGDFDEDGRVDAATSSFANDEVIVFRGDGAGGFGPPLRIPAGPFSVRVAAADLDGDGHLDLASCNRDAGSVSVLLGDGAGGFAGAVPHEVGRAPTAIAAADMDGDGHADLVTADSVGRTVTVLRGDGRGGFEERTLEGFEVTGFALPADLDADGDMDLVVAHGDDVSILLGAGDGALERKGDLRVGSAILMMAAGDLNDDGRDDLVTANWDRGDVSIFPGDGSGGFGEPADLQVRDGPWGVLPVDLNGDGREDLVVTSELANTMTVFLNRSFDRAPFRRGDSNADGRLDISDGVSILDFLFLGRAAPRCRAALDADGDREIVITDGIYVLQHLFGGGPAPAAPYPGCGLDAETPLECREPTGGCEESGE